MKRVKPADKEHLAVVPIIHEAKMILLLLLVATGLAHPAPREVQRGDYPHQDDYLHQGDYSRLDDHSQRNHYQQHDDYSPPAAADYYLVGDVRHSKAHDSQASRRGGVTGGRVDSLVHRRWPHGMIPYTIQQDYPDWLSALIYAAMTQLETAVGQTETGSGNQKRAFPVPCVQFVARSTERHFLEIRDEGSCHATIGFHGGTRSVLSVSPFCARLGVLRHQLLHVLGFGHEQERPDRDQYLQLHPGNMAQASLFAVSPRSAHLHDLGLPYDFRSVTHFGPYTGAKDPRMPVMTPRSEHAPGIKLGETRWFSPTDVLRVQRLYRCVEREYTSSQAHHAEESRHDDVLLACDFEHGPCGMAPHRRDITEAGESSRVAGDDNRGRDGGVAENGPPQWSVVVGATPNGPAAGRTNGLDPYLYVSSRLSQWAETGDVRIVGSLASSNRRQNKRRHHHAQRHRHQNLNRQGSNKIQSSSRHTEQTSSYAETIKGERSLSAHVAALLLAAGGPGVPLLNSSVFTPPFRPRSPDGKICVDLQIYQTDNRGGLTLMLHAVGPSSSSNSYRSDLEQKVKVAEAEPEAEVLVVEQLNGIVLEGWTWTGITVQAQHGRRYRLELLAEVGGGSVAVDDLYIVDGQCA